MPRYTLIGRNEFPSTEPERMGKIDVAYAYMDENMKTITFFLHSEEDTPEKAEEELRKRIEAQRTAGPRVIEIE